MPTTKDRTEYKRLYRSQHKAEIAEKFKVWVEKNKSQRSQYMKGYMKSYYQEHKDTIKARSAAWYKAHPDEASLAQKERYDRDRERILEKCKEYVAKNAEKTARYQQQYRRENEERMAPRKAMQGMKRRATMKKVTVGVITEEDIVRLWISTPHCPDCGITITRKNRSIDHIQPIAKGGEHSLANLRICCRRCNSKKGSK